MPADRAELLALAERAEAGGDDRLSDDVWRAMGWRPIVEGRYGLHWLPPRSPLGIPGPRPDLRVSLDAQEAVPGRIAKMQWLPKHKLYGAEVEELPTRTEPAMPCFAPTEPLARLAAKLRAMAAATPEEGA